MLVNTIPKTGEMCVHRQKHQQSTVFLLRSSSIVEIFIKENLSLKYMVDYTGGYRLSSNTAEDLQQAALRGVHVVDQEVWNAIQKCEPCIFAYSTNTNLPKSYGIRQYKCVNMPGGSSLLTKIVPSKILDNSPIYKISEEPVTEQGLYWQHYRHAKHSGDSDRAKRITQKLIVPEDEKVRGVGISASHTDRVARNIALKRAHDIAKKTEMPVLEDVIDSFVYPELISYKSL